MAAAISGSTSNIGRDIVFIICNLLVKLVSTLLNINLDRLDLLPELYKFQRCAIP